MEQNGNRIEQNGMEIEWNGNIMEIKWKQNRGMEYNGMKREQGEIEYTPDIKQKTGH